MNSFEWFLLIVVVIVVPLIIAVVVTLWTIDQANKRKRANRKDAQIGVKRKAALSPEEVEARKAARAEKQAAAEAEAARAGTINNRKTPETGSSTVSSTSGNDVTINNPDGESPRDTEPAISTPGSSDAVSTPDSGSSDSGGGGSDSSTD